MKRKKCTFLHTSVKYLGHVIDQSGLHTSDDKVADIINAPQPTNVTELRSFLGLINYYGKFLRNLSTVLHPLNCLLHKNHTWKWTLECKQAFNQCKEMIASSDVLVHYDINMPVHLACDASPYGVGAVLSHEFPDGTERPIAFASRTLTKTEKSMLRLIKKPWESFLVFNDFINTYTEDISVLLQTIVPLQLCLGRVNLSLYWLLQECNDGP